MVFSFILNDGKVLADLQSFGNEFQIVAPPPRSPGMQNCFFPQPSFQSCKLSLLTRLSNCKQPFLSMSGHHVQQSPDSLLDLGVDLNSKAIGAGNSQPEEAAASSLLDEQFKMLGLDSGISVNHNQTTTALQVSLPLDSFVFSYVF